MPPVEDVPESELPKPEESSGTQVVMVPAVTSRVPVPVPALAETAHLPQVTVTIAMPPAPENPPPAPQAQPEEASPPGKVLRNDLRRLEANRWNIISSGAFLSGVILPLISIYTKLPVIGEWIADGVTPTKLDVAQGLAAAGAIMCAVLLWQIAKRKAREALADLED